MNIKWKPPRQPLSVTQVQILSKLYETIALVKQGNAKASSNKALSVWRLCEVWGDEEDA